MAHAVKSPNVRPIIEMNMTPLIDVLLVLLVMFIITIPLQSHAVKLDLPARVTIPERLIDPIRNEVAIAPNDQIFWNGSAVIERQLAGLLSATHEKHPDSELHLKPQPDARYEVVDEVLAMTKRAQVSRMGFVGNEAYARF